MHKPRWRPPHHMMSHNHRSGKCFKKSFVAGWWIFPAVFFFFMMFKFSFFLWFLWPLAALIVFGVIGSKMRYGGHWHHRGEWGAWGPHDPRKSKHDDYPEKRKNDDQPRYIRTADGEWLEVIEPDDDTPPGRSPYDDEGPRYV